VVVGSPVTYLRTGFSVWDFSAVGLVGLFLLSISGELEGGLQCTGPGQDKMTQKPREALEWGRGVLMAIPLILRASSFATAVVLLAVSYSTAFGQTQLYVLVGDDTGERFGQAVSGAGDLNADGFDDFLIGAPDDGTNGNQAGQVRVFSGVDGTLLFDLYGDAPGDLFGNAVAAAGDVNADGRDDFIVGAVWADNNGSMAGRVRVFSGVDASVLHTFDGLAGGDFFGIRVAGVGDVNADGHDDLLVGAVQWLYNGTGYAQVLSGSDGSVIYQFTGDGIGDQLGYSVDGVGDVNADGTPDMIVGAWMADSGGSNSGMARVFSGLDGSLLYQVDGPFAGDVLGASVAGTGDVDGDGRPDFIAGASGSDGNGSYSGAAHVYSGASGALLYSFDGNSAGDQFGNCVGGAGDVNGDGYNDLIVGAINDDAVGADGGSATLFSGRDGSILAFMPGNAPGDSAGASVKGAGDVNGDGLDDFIVGHMLADTTGPRAGRAVVWGGAGCGVISRCQGAPNSAGSGALMAHSGSTSVAANDLVLLAGGCPTNQFGIFYYGADYTQISFGTGYRCVSPGGVGLFRFSPVNTGGSGVGSWSLDYLNPPQASGQITAGSTWHFQFWYRDPVAGGANFNLSDGLEVAFCP
jgi:hypothetical protein